MSLSAITMTTLAHIINPVVVKPTSDLFFAQPATFESMRRSAEYANEQVNVELLATCYEEDQAVVPTGFTNTPFLSRSVLDLGEFSSSRKLPILNDILTRCYDQSRAEYIIYSNVDIAVLPFFYDSIAAIISQGYDAFIINRRTISQHYSDISQLPLMYADAGERHRGFDCFIFRRTLLNDFFLHDVCIGMKGVGLALMLNMYAAARSFKIFEDSHLTFHIGNDKAWKSRDFDDIRAHNDNAVRAIIMDLEKQHGSFSKEMPGWGYSAVRKYKSEYISGSGATKVNPLAVAYRAVKSYVCHTRR